MIWKIIGGIIVIALIAGGFFYWQSTQNKSESTEETTETTITETPTPTTEEVDKSQYQIEILNGSGIAGEAGRAQELLEEADFEVSSTGNADNYDYEETVIQAGSDVSDVWLDQLIATLEEKYTVQTRIEDHDDAEGVTVIIGSLDDSGESMSVEEDPTPTPEEEEEDSEDPTNTPSPTP